MTDQIKVSEVSAILREQLEGINTTIHLEEVGTVLQVSDGVARIYGLDNAEANELLPIRQRNGSHRDEPGRR